METPLATIGGAIRTDAFFNAGDNSRHMVVATNGGDIYDISYRDIGSDPSPRLVANAAIAIDIGGCFDPQDGHDPAFVATADGSVLDISFGNSSGAPVLTTLANGIVGLTRISAYLAEDDFFPCRIQAAADDGRIRELRYGPHEPPIQAINLRSDPRLDLGGFYSDDDEFRHAILLTSDGEVQELFFNP